MSWSSTAYAGPAKEYVFELQSPANKSDLSTRSVRQVEAVKKAMPILLSSLGDCHVTAGAGGHTTDKAGEPGDSVSISIGSIAELPQSSE
jgi:hypothetical protein